MTPIVDSDKRLYPSPEYAQRIRFEGNECVVMAPEEYEALYELARRLECNLNTMVASLKKIERWQDFPDTDRKWPDGQWMSYSAAFGSNGERDYMRGIARQALQHPTS